MPKGEAHVVAYASRALKKAEMNYTPFLAEMMCAVWAMNHFGFQLRGRKFKLFSDHKPLEKLGKTQTKTLNRLHLLVKDMNFEWLCLDPGEFDREIKERIRLF